MSLTAPMRVLWHGTTRRRAEAIIAGGPNPNYREPNSTERIEKFSAAPRDGPFLQGDPLVIAKGKAALFPNEGGPVIVEFAVPEEIVRLADFVVEVRFLPGFGMEELLQLWPELPKQLIDVPTP